MQNNHRRWIFVLLMLFATLALAIYAWRLSRQASIVVEWSTGSETDTVGFNVYRSDTEDGAGQKINLELIPASNDPLAGSQYHFDDGGVSPGKTYYYFLEALDSSGSASRDGPAIVKAVAGGRVEAILAGLLGVVTLLMVVTSLGRFRGPRKIDHEG